jgi:hypothetical protein
MAPRLLTILALAIVLVSSAVAAGARGTSSIQGTITDAKHSRPMMSVSVTAFFADGGAWAGSSQTGKDGVFHLQGLAPGQYRLFITKPGFRSVEVTGLAVDANDHLIVGFPIALEAAPFSDADPVQLVARCNNLVNPDEVADVYVVCGGT